MSQEDKPVSFKREPRYIVLKIKDALNYPSTCQLDRLQELGEEIEEGRKLDGKATFNAVVVEQDWTEFEPGWAMIEAKALTRLAEKSEEWDMVQPRLKALEAKLASANAVIQRLKVSLTDIAEYANALATQQAQTALFTIAAYDKGEYLDNFIQRTYKA